MPDGRAQHETHCTTQCKRQQTSEKAQNINSTLTHAEAHALRQDSQGLQMSLPQRRTIFLEAERYKFALWFTANFAHLFGIHTDIDLQDLCRLLICLAMWHDRVYSFIKKLTKCN